MFNQHSFVTCLLPVTVPGSGTIIRAFTSPQDLHSPNVWTQRQDHNNNKQDISTYGGFQRCCPKIILKIILLELPLESILNHQESQPHYSHTYLWTSTQIDYPSCLIVLILYYFKNLNLSSENFLKHNICLVFCKVKFTYISFVPQDKKKLLFLSPFYV